MKASYLLITNKIFLIKTKIIFISNADIYLNHVPDVWK